MATIGRSRAIVDLGGGSRLSGFPAWLVWLAVHIYFLVGFRNRLFVVLSWAWSYLTFRRGARLILNRAWREEVEPRDPDALASPSSRTRRTRT